MDFKTPGFRDWLGFQVHRNDLIGTLARLAASSNRQISEAGFDSWISEMAESPILRHEVDEARAQYRLCVEDIGRTGHSKTFPAMLRSGATDGEMSSLWEKHKSSPDVSAETYLHQLHKDLRKKVEPVRRLYLDTCHWIGLRDVELGRSTDRRYVALLETLRKLKAHNKILCPFSFPIFHELTKQTDDRSRRSMAALIDELSDGICIQPPDQIERIELKRQILASVLGATAPDAWEWIWTKAGYVLGEMFFESEAPFTPEQKVLLQKVLIDTFWNSNLLAVVEFNSTSDSAERMQSLANAFNLDANKYREGGASFDQVLMEDKAINVRQLVKNDLEKLGLEVAEQFPRECAAFAARHGSMQPPDPGILASIQIKSGVHASFIISSRTMKLKPTDLIDAVHASMALPYFDAALLERPLATRLTTRPLEFDRIYKVRVDWNVDSFLGWLGDL